MVGQTGKYIFGSKDWVEAFVAVLNTNDEYARAAKDWEDPIALMVTDLPPSVREYFGSDRVVVWLDLYHGRCRGFEMLKDVEDKKAPIIIAGSYENMKKVAQGRLSPTIAVMTGQLRVKGNVGKLLSNASASSAFVNAIKKVPTEFLA
jgi:putative sterol carrier protein